MKASTKRVSLVLIDCYKVDARLTLIVIDDYHVWYDEVK